MSISNTIGTVVLGTEPKSFREFRTKIEKVASAYNEQHVYI